MYDTCQTDPVLYTVVLSIYCDSSFLPHKICLKTVWLCFHIDKMAVSHNKQTMMMSIMDMSLTGNVQRWHCGVRNLSKIPSTWRHSLTGTVKMASMETLHHNSISAALAVCLGLLSVLTTGTCDEQVPLILWTSEGWACWYLSCFVRFNGLWRSYSRF